MEENKGSSVTKKPWWQSPRNVLQIITITIALISAGMIYCFNLQYPSLEVGRFPMSSVGIALPSHGYIGSSFPNQTTNEFNISVKEGYAFANLTFQVANVGKGTVYDVDVTIRGNPSNECAVVEMVVYAGEPTETNFLKVAKYQSYFIGMLLPQRFYVFVCSVKWEITSLHEKSFVLSVTSSNAGRKEYSMIFE